MAAGTVSRTTHFALHRCSLQPPVVAADAQPAASSPAGLQLTFGVWMGALIPKRWAKRAVTRNTIRRQIYAVSEDCCLPAAAHVVRLRAGFDRKLFISATSEVLKAAVRVELRQLFERAPALRPSSISGASTT